MKVSEFIEHCDVCGGNWTAMMLTGVKRCWPEEYAKLEDREHTFDEVYKLTQKLGVEW